MIDTLRASKTLQKNGFSLQQSDILAKVIAQQSEELATRQDIQLLKKDTETLQLAMMQDIQLLKKDMETLRTDVQTLQEETKENILALRNDLTKSMRHLFWFIALLLPIIMTTMITILVLFAQQ
ncbi:MAG: hypothetical protein ACR2PY_02110 [Salinispira sp.]